MPLLHATAIAAAAERAAIIDYAITLMPYAFR